MDVVGLAFTLFGHLLASVLYIWRRIPFSSASDAVDRSSILENKDQLREIWERRIMADDQAQATNESVAPNTGTREAGEKLESKKATIVVNGTSSPYPRSEGPDKGDPETHDSGDTDRASTDHNHTDPVTISEEKEAVTNGNETSIETNQTDHVDSLKHENSQEEHEQEAVPKEEEKILEKTENTPCETSTTEEGHNGCHSDDQKADKVDDHEKNEVVCHSQDDINKDDGLIDKEKEVDNVERETRTEKSSDCCADAIQVADHTEEPLDEPDTETYYTSNFTFVCQKSHEEDEQEIEEQQISEESDAVLEKKDISEANIEIEITLASEKENAEPVETPTCDDNNNADIVSKSGTEDVLESSFSDASRPVCTESPENALEGEAEAICGSQHPCERAMTSDFQEANGDEAENIPQREMTSEKGENESEIDVDVYNKLNNNITEREEEKDLPSRVESATPDSDAELKTEKIIERPSHFVRLKRTGVQKTERPYDSGTTESKIAMEIREMREREEELRLMRERMQSPEGNNTSSVSSSSSPLLSPTSPSKPSQGNSGSLETGPGYRVSTVFGHKGSSPVPSPMEEEKKIYRTFSKESAVEKEIRLARNREEELRKEKGLPPREDDSYIKPSQVKSSQVRVFGKMNASNNSKELATTKIQQEIEEQTLREMALREKGHIQTISQERTDSKVAKLKDLDVSLPECTSPASPNGHGPFSDRSSKRSTPSPTGSSHGSFPPVSPRPVGNQGKGISMQKFIASKGKETTFIASRNGPSHPEPNADASRSNPVMRKAKRTVSVESKIQQEILEMKLREEELRRMHNSSTEQSFLTSGENGTALVEVKNDVSDYVNGQEINGNDDLGPSSNNLIAQWEQRIQKAEGRA